MSQLAESAKVVKTQRLSATKSCLIACVAGFGAGLSATSSVPLVQWCFLAAAVLLIRKNNRGVITLAIWAAAMELTRSTAVNGFVFDIDVIRRLAATIMLYGSTGFLFSNAKLFLLWPVMIGAVQTMILAFDKSANDLGVLALTIASTGSFSLFALFAYTAIGAQMVAYISSRFRHSTVVCGAIVALLTVYEQSATAQSSVDPIWCDPPIPPYEYSAEEHVEFRDEIKIEFEEYMTSLENYLECMNRERTRAMNEGREQAQRYGTFLNDDD